MSSERGTGIPARRFRLLDIWFLIFPAYAIAFYVWAMLRVLPVGVVSPHFPEHSPNYISWAEYRFAVFSHLVIFATVIVTWVVVFPRFPPGAKRAALLALAAACPPIFCTLAYFAAMRRPLVAPRTTIVSFENHGFCTQDTDDTPRGSDAAEYIVDELTKRGVNAHHVDFCDFYAHIVGCRIRRRFFELTIGFVGDDELMIEIGDGVAGVLRILGVSDEPERLTLAKLLNEMLETNGFRGVKWWTRQQWAGAQRKSFASPA